MIFRDKAVINIPLPENVKSNLWQPFLEKLAKAVMTGRKPQEGYKYFKIRVYRQCLHYLQVLENLLYLN